MRTAPSAAPIAETIHDWTSAAACNNNADPDELFVTGAAQNRAKTVCLSCPVRAECLADALDNRVEFGVWGGMTERERRAVLKRRPEVTSWKQLFADAKSATAAVS
ncbi:MAG: transcription factor WhiB [Frankiales bacterium]|nr:transcription factor WhiB [Frankiales bacterium]